jgi:hypothetical protein
VKLVPYQLLRVAKAKKITHHGSLESLRHRSSSVRVRFPKWGGTRIIGGDGVDIGTRLAGNVVITGPQLQTRKG